MTGTQSVLENKNLHIIFGITLVSVMGVASITPAFPEIIRHFQITPEQVGWLIATFTLPGIFLTPIMGILADRLGRKPVLIPSLVLFGIAGAACLFTGNFKLLLAFRFLQGIGASALASINVTLIGDLFSGEQRVAAMGYNASVLSVGTASYPAVGGLLTAMGWEMVFLLPVLAIPLAIWVMLHLQNPEPAAKSNLATYFSNVWQTVNRTIVWGLFSTNVLLFVILYGAYLTYFPLLLETRMQSDSVVIGISMSLMSVVTAVTSFQLPTINRLIKPRIQLLLAAVFYWVSMILLSRAFSWSEILAALAIFGLGHGMAIPAIQNLMVGLASIHERAAFMSLNSMVLRIGQTLGPLLVGLFYQQGGITYAFRGGSVVAVVLFLFIAILVYPKPAEKPKH